MKGLIPCPATIISSYNIHVMYYLRFNLTKNYTYMYIIDVHHACTSIISIAKINICPTDPLEVLRSGLVYYSWILPFIAASNKHIDYMDQIICFFSYHIYCTEWELLHCLSYSGPYKHITVGLKHTVQLPKVCWKHFAKEVKCLFPLFRLPLCLYRNYLLH